MARFRDCQRGLRRDLTKGEVHWSENKTQVTKAICKAVTKVNKFVP